MSNTWSVQQLEAIPTSEREFDNYVASLSVLYEYLAAWVRLNTASRHQQRYDWLDRRFANLRHSFTWLAEQTSTEAAHLLLTYVEGLAASLGQRGLHAELLHWCEDGLKACEHLRYHSGTLLLLCAEGQQALGLWNEARASTQAAIESSESLEPELYARSLTALGRLLFNQGEYREGLGILECAAALPAPKADERKVILLSERAAYALKRADFRKALALYLEIERFQRERGAHETTDHLLLMLGVAYRRKKKRSNWLPLFSNYLSSVVKHTLTWKQSRLLLIIWGGFCLIKVTWSKLVAYVEIPCCFLKSLATSEASPTPMNNWEVSPLLKDAKKRRSPT